MEHNLQQDIKQPSDCLCLGRPAAGSYNPYCSPQRDAWFASHLCSQCCSALDWKFQSFHSWLFSRSHSTRFVRECKPFTCVRKTSEAFFLHLRTEQNRHVKVIYSFQCAVKAGPFKKKKQRMQVTVRWLSSAYCWCIIVTCPFDWGRKEKRLKIGMTLWHSALHLHVREPTD